MENKRILIIGGTGTLGKELIRNLYRKNKISVLSRDEHKQALLKKKNIHSLSFILVILEI